MALNESEVIELLSGIFATRDQRLHIGIGDDAAVVAGFAQQILTTDIAVEGVHFKREWSTGYEIGQRIAAANIADVISMNGRCDYLLVAASLTGNESLQWIGELARGIADTAKEAGAIVVGGDISQSPSLQFAVNVIAKVQRRGKRGRSAIPAVHRCRQQPSRYIFGEQGGACDAAHRGVPPLLTVLLQDVWIASLPTDEL